ncbi:MAG: hydantoinase/oxoprolinase family protein, partial [Betaproteobacteria bacterium]|nr:hydantoinase/oxoprolinase family protein [Betaproteobacteria bacterium]
MSGARSAPERCRVGIDIGGTFTDVVLMSERRGPLAKYKVDTTPASLEACFVHGLRRATDGLPPEAVTRILHATTVATNTVLEAKGARTALVVTAGFRDILEIARQRRPNLYDLKAEKARPLIPRRLCFEVRERIDSEGRVVTELTDEELARVCEQVRGARVESVVIATLFSYLNPRHEMRIKQHLEDALPGLCVVASSEVVPEFREFERASTAALVGYLKPAFVRHTGNLVRELARLRHAPGKLLIMSSAGGLMSPQAARERPHTVVESGPAAGVIAAATLARELGERNVISFDMGGTTAKASLIEGGGYRTTTEYEIGAGMHQSLAVRFTGYPIKAPIIDLTECSAGGGSIASVDALGVLKVGPRSAGADPGPVCYGRGGAEPTVTDANLVLGRINPDYFIGGEARLDVGCARAVIEERIARPLRLSVTQAAAGILAVVNAHMVRILRVVSVSRGHDPREFSLVAFGGAGPLHAADLATELHIPRIVIPEAPGLFSALGLLWADLRADFSATVRRNLETGSAVHIEAALDALEADARAWLAAEGVPSGRQVLARSADVRYPLQNYEINVALPGGGVDAAWMKRACDSFHQAHQRLYSHCDRDSPVQIVNLRVTAIGRTERVRPPRIRSGRGKIEQARKGERPVYFG